MTFYSFIDRNDRKDIASLDKTKINRKGMRKVKD